MSALALILVALLAQDEQDDENTFDRIEASVVIELEAAVGTGRGRSQKLEYLVKPELVAELPWEMELTVSGLLRADLFDELEPGKPSLDTYSHYSRRGLLGDHVDMELREFYLDATVDETYLRIGKQQIVWGEADGLKVLDVVNPQSFREFILDDFEDSRIPLWSVKTETPLGENTTLEVIWIPDQTYHELPEPDSIYAFPLPEPPAGVGLELRDINRPRAFRSFE